MSKQPTMAELRTRCAELGITPGRSIAETLARIETREAAAEIGAAIHDAATIGTGVLHVSVPEFAADAMPDIRRVDPAAMSIDPVALEANWRMMEAAKQRIQAPCFNRFPLMASTALKTGFPPSYTPVYTGKPAMTVDEISAELRQRFGGRR